MNTEELIQDYIANRLSDEEKARVEKLLETEAEWQEAYATHKELAYAFQLSEKNAIKKRLQALDGEKTPSRKSKLYQGKLGRIAVACVFIMGIFYMLMMLPSNGNLYESYFEICPNTYLPVTRGNTTQDFEYEAFKAYENNDFATSETAFRQLLATENNPNIQFYYAMSLLNQQKFDAALQELQTLSNENFDYQVESLWYAALIQIKKDKKEDAKQYLSKIQQLNSSYKTDEINSILARL